MPPRLIYLHGFRSSPRSFKASWLASRLAGLGLSDRYVCPQLPASPREAIALVDATIAPRRDDTLVGSSLGGYYATWLAERCGCRCVLLNPAVRPAEGLAAHVGVQTQYHSDEPFEFKPVYLDELRELDVARITDPARYLLIAATGDELLDWRDMVAHYPGARHRIVAGSDHGLSDFADYGDDVLAFAGLIGEGQ
ncbi:MAG: YqiA/YcfP family alpha/beta fold hydrolase [Burkholderiaceae bacterium]